MHLERRSTCRRRPCAWPPRHRVQLTQQCLQHDPHTAQSSFRHSAVGNGVPSTTLTLRSRRFGILLWVTTVSPARPSHYSRRFGILLWVRTQLLQHEPHTTQPSFRHSAVGNNTVPPARPSNYTAVVSALCVTTLSPARPSLHSRRFGICCG